MKHFHAHVVAEWAFIFLLFSIIHWDSSHIVVIILTLCVYVESLFELFYTAMRSTQDRVYTILYCGGQLVAGSFGCKTFFIFSLFYVIAIFTLLILISIFIKTFCAAQKYTIFVIELIRGSYTYVRLYKRMYWFFWENSCEQWNVVSHNALSRKFVIKISIHFKTTMEFIKTSCDSFL